MANFNRLKSFRSKDKELKNAWVNNVQNQDGYLYTTNFHLFVRAAYESKFEGEAFEDESKLNLSAWFDRGEYLGDLRKPSFLKLLEIETAIEHTTLKLFGFCCNREYVRKILALESNFECYRSEQEKRGLILVGSQYEIVLMSCLHEKSCFCIEISKL